MLDTSRQMMSSKTVKKNVIDNEARECQERGKQKQKMCVVKQ
jgi:hypothetical protein